MKLQQQAFTLVEIIVAIVVFLIGVSGIYAIMQATMNTNSYNRDYIIATNLAREQIELVRNIRDTNFAKIQAYDYIYPLASNPDFSVDANFFGKELVDGGGNAKVKYYKISNDFENTTDEEVSVTLKTTPFDDSDIYATGNENYRVCRDEGEKLYGYCDEIGSSGIPTNFYKYIKITPVTDTAGNTINGFKVTSEVVWKNRTVHSFDIKAIFTDYKIF